MMLHNFLDILNRKSEVALPEGDEAQIYSRSVSVVPLKGRSAARPYYHQVLIDMQQKGKWTPKVYLLPDVGKFEIELMPFNPALLANGIISRYPSPVTLYKNRNRRLNRYLVYSYYRLLVNKERPQVYWAISSHLIQQSSSYLAACMHGIDKNIYRSREYSYLLRLIKRLNKLRGENPLIAHYSSRKGLNLRANPIVLQSRYIQFCRVYLPKGETYRPLGVPSMAWRIYMRMWLFPMMGYTGHRIPQQFHGYMPGRGTATAWQQILGEVIHSGNIYEIDFKGFFPSIHTDILGNFMSKDWNIPSQVTYFYYQMNQSLPLYLGSKAEDLLEGEVRWTPAHQDTISSQCAINNMFGFKGHGLSHLHPLGDAYRVAKEANVYNLKGGKLRPSIVKSRAPMPVGSIGIYDNPDINQAWIEAQTVTPKTFTAAGNPLARAFRSEFSNSFEGNVGLPQGGPISPYLSILYLSEVLHQMGLPDDVKFIFYADDGIFYSDNYESLNSWITKSFTGDSSPSQFGFYNLTIAATKSAWVKQGGVWLKPLKFLGLVYVPGKTLAESHLVAQTRSGKSNLKLSKDELLKWSYSSHLLGDTRAYALKGRISLLKGFKQNAITKTMIFYYENLLKIHSKGYSFASLENAYLWSSTARKGAFHLVAFMITGAHNLFSRRSLQRYLEVLDEGFKVLPLAEFGEAEIERAELLVAFLKSGYYAAHKEDTIPPSNRLLDLLATSPTTTGHLEAIVGNEEYIKETLSAPYFFGQHFNAVTVTKRIRVSGGVTLRELPLNLMEFIQTSLRFFGLSYSTTTMNREEEASIEADLTWRYHSYLNRYFNRNKWRNFINSRFYGLLFSRMYIGSWRLLDFEQNFEFSYNQSSLAHFLESHWTNQVSTSESINIFNGSSYAFKEIVRMTSQLKRSSRGKTPYVFFAEGVLPQGSWDSLGTVQSSE